MKTTLLKTGIVAAALLQGIAANAQTYYGEFFTHTATAATNNGNTTNLTHPSLDGNTGARIITTQNWNLTGVYADFVPGVWYSGTPGWSIYNEDAATAFVENSSWNVLIPVGNGTIFTHTTTASNISSQMTIIDHPALNNNPDAIIFVQHNWSSNGSGVYNNHNVGVWYTGTNWSIYNEDLAAMPENAVFDIFVPNPGDNAFKHTATLANTSGQYTIIDNALTNNQPNRVIFALHNFGPAGGEYNDHPIGVWYTGTNWSVFNQDIEAITEGTTFNILVVDSLETSIGEQAANSNFMTIYPNPAADNTTLGYVLNEPGDVQITVVNMLGQKVVDVYAGHQQKGNFTQMANTAQLAPGMYYYVLTVDGIQSRKAFMKN